MEVSRYFIEFIVYSFLGWVYECLFCLIKERRLENRGFLFGPVCPIYGTGGVIAVLLFSDASYPDYAVFLVSALGSIVLEYSTSYILEKRFHAVWWDYTNVPFNLNGRVCLPATLGFGVAGVAFYRVIVPLSEKLHDQIPSNWSEGIALALAAVFIGDLVLTVSFLNQFKRSIDFAETEVNASLQEAGKTADTIPLQAKEEAIAKFAARIRDYVAHLPHLQRHTLRRIKHFSTRFSTSLRVQLAENMKAAADVIRKGGAKVKRVFKQEQDQQEDTK